MSAILKPSLVVVDDEPQVLAAIEDQLEDEFIVHAASSGKTALELIAELKNVSVVLADQRMPGMGGDELFARAAEISDATRVLITGYADLEAVIRAVNKGRIFGYLTKPWDRQGLSVMMRRAEEHYRLVRELNHERELLHNLMENVPDEIYFKGLDHRYIRINSAGARGQGIVSPKAAIGRLDADFMRDSSWVEAVHAEDLRVAESGNPLTVDELRVRPDSTGYWVSKTKAPVRDSRGKVVSIVMIARDVTDRKLAEQESRLLYAVSDAIAAASGVDDALRAVLQTLSEAIDWEYGEAWMMTEGALRIRANWHIADQALAGLAAAWRNHCLAPGCGLVGKVWSNVEPMWIHDLAQTAEQESFLRRDEAQAAGLHAVLAVPVCGDDGLPRAVLLLFRRAPQPAMERVVLLATAVARQLGGAIERKQSAAQLATREILLRSVLDALPVGVRVADRTGRILMQNPAAERICGASPEGERPRAWWPDNGNPIAAAEWPIPRALASGKSELGSIIEIERPDASRRIVAASGVPIREGGDTITGALMVVEDITERRAQEARIARLTRMHATLSAINTTIVRAKNREELFREACRAVVETGKFLFLHVWLLDTERHMLMLAAHAGADALRIGDIVLDAQSTDGRPTAVNAYFENRTVVVNDLHSEQSPSPMQSTMMENGCRAVVSLPMQRDGSCIGVLSFGSADADFFDDEELKLLAELTGDVSFALETLDKSDRLYFLSAHDPLTGLSNRASFVEQLARMIPVSGDKLLQFALAAVNLKRFRNVNESLGRHLGDELLRQVGDRLAAYAGRERVARFGADVFCVLLHDVAGAKDATRAAARIREALSTSYELSGQELRVDARIAIALYPADGGDAEVLCGNVETTLQRTRGADETIMFYKSELNARVAEQLNLENRLRIAVKERQFVLYCQPKVAAQSGKVIGAEALIRWQDPQEGLIPPGRFIPVLEETGLITEVGEWALEEAARIYERMHARGLACPRIAVNISQVQMRRPDFVREVLEAVGRGAEGRHGVDLEITESLLAENIEEAVRKLKLLRETGFAIAVDDFGTGYSSLGYLAKLPVDALKIDRSFIVNMTEDANSMALVSTIINLAHSFRLNVVAEGVETEEQLKMLRLLRCDEIQGYLFHKPLPEAQFAMLLEKAGDAPK